MPPRTNRIRRRGANRWSGLQQLLGRIEATAARTDLTLKAGERALKRCPHGARRRCRSSRPSRTTTTIVQRLKAAQTALMPKVQELRDVADWQRWANIGIQEQLCEKMEALKAVEDPEMIASAGPRAAAAVAAGRRRAARAGRSAVAAVQDGARRSRGRGAKRTLPRRPNARRESGEEDRAVRARRGARRFDQLDSDRRRDQEAAGRVEDDRAGESRPGEGDLGTLPRCLRSLLHPPARRPRRAQDASGPTISRGRKRCAPRPRRSRIRPTGTPRRGDQAAAGRVEDDRPGEEEPVGSAVAAFPRRVRSLLRALRAAPRHRAR